MVRLIGSVYGTDRKGNYKVKSTDFLRPVVLSGSSAEKFKLGDEISFEVTSYGDNVDFSRSYELADQSKEVILDTLDTAKSQADIKKSIDMVLLDETTRDILIVGYWDSPEFVPYEWKGKICNKMYLLTDQRKIGVTDTNSLAKRLGISTKRIFEDRYNGHYAKSALKFVWAVPEHLDRIAVEKAVLSHL